jgi:hypothetical protein
MAESWDSGELYFSSEAIKEMFVQQYSNVVAKLSYEKCLWDLALLCDISHQVTDINTKLQVQQKLISEVFGAVRTFGINLKVFQYQLENVKLSFFLLRFASLLRMDQ